MLTISITHIRFRRAYVHQGFAIEDLPYRALWYPYGAYWVAISNLFLLLIQGYGCFIDGFDYVDFIVSYIVVVVFVALFVFWKFYKKTKWVTLKDMDLVSGKREDLVPESELERKPTLFKRAKNTFFA